MPIDRRGLLLGAAVVTATLASAEGASAVINLWPDAPPGGAGPRGPEYVDPDGAHRAVNFPRIEVWRPEKPNGTGVLIIAGGGYRRIGIAKEAEPTATWLTSIGVTAFVLYYRLPDDEWLRSAPFQDAQRAMRIIRGRAASFGIDPTRVGIIGFSAGGHLAGMTTVQPDADLYPAFDPLDRFSARPDFAGLIYPVLTFIPPYITKVTTRTLLGDNPSLDLREAFSAHRLVGPGTPPTFLVHANDDTIAPAENSLFMFSALRAARVPAAMHMFRKGGHGFNIGAIGTEPRIWPQLFATWANLT